MTFYQLIEELGDNSKDTKINLKKLLLNPVEEILDLKSLQALSLAVSYSLQHSSIVAAALQFATELDEQHRDAALLCANVMAMNNVYYRSLHLLDDPVLLQMPAGLRMQGLMRHGIDKALFELMAFSISSINGCGMCLKAHHQQLKAHFTPQQISYTLKIAAVLNALKQCDYYSG